MRNSCKKKKSSLHIEITAKPWRRVRELKAFLEKTVIYAFRELPEDLRPLAKRASCTLLLSSDKEVCRLNHDFRGLRKPTNVLSFPQLTKRELAHVRRGKGEVYLGDIAIAYKYTAEEARREHKILKNHVAHLMIHGLLHLFGYDHDTDAAQRRMERLEKRIMASLGLPDPYAPWSRL